MPLELIRADITKLEVDAVVNAANETLLGGGGVDGAIHRAAGAGLLKECMGLHGCKTGEAKITGGYKMPCRHIIHTVGPVWRDGRHGEEELLYSCYKNSLTLAEQNGCESVAFPLISSGIYGYPKAEALSVATRAITDFLNATEKDMLVYIVIFDRKAFVVSSTFWPKMEQRIDDFYAEQAVENDYRYGRRSRQIPNLNRRFSGSIAGRKPNDEKALTKSLNTEADGSFLGTFAENDICECSAVPEHFELDESFVQMLLRKIDESGMTDPQCYKKANVDRKLFSKIHSDYSYKPSKQTVLAFAVALELPIEETNEMLKKAGYALSSSLMSDVIVEYCITHGIYNVFEINEMLFKYDQPTLH